MRLFRTSIFSLALSAGPLAFLQGAYAHNIGKMEKELSAAERYTQIVNKPAPGFSLQDTDGRKVSLEDFSGNPVVLYFLYARCKDECPLHSLKIKQVQAQIAEAGLSGQVQFVAIATDTEDATSTAELMRQHPQHYGLDAANWVFLFGGPARESAGTDLARAYSLEFTPVGESVQIHGVVTHLIDPAGRMRARYHGLDFDSVSLVSYAAALLHGEHGASTGSASGETRLTPTDWALSALGLFCLVLLLWAAWTYLVPRRMETGKTASSDP